MKLLEKIKFISPAKEYDFNKFVNDTSICTSTMIIKINILKNTEFINSEICEDYFFKCKIKNMQCILSR